MCLRKNVAAVVICSLGLSFASAPSIALGAAKDEEHRKLADEYVKRGNITGALHELDKIGQPTADDYSWQGELLIQLGRPQFEDASAAFRKALKIDGGNARALYGLGVVALFQKHYEEAESLLRKALEVQPRNLHTQNGLAGVLMYQKKFGEAESVFLSLETEPSMAAIAKGNLGELYFHQGRLNLAQSKLKEAISRQPDNFDWHRWLGEVYRFQDNKHAAITEYRKTLELLEKSRWADAALITEIRTRIRELSGK